MAASLQDQLLSKGLINKNKAKKIQQEQQQKKKISRKHKTEYVDEAKLAAEQAQKAKAELDKKLNQELKAKAEEKAIAAQIKQLIDNNSIEVTSKEVAFTFQHAGKSQSLVVERAQEAQIKKGRLVIVQQVEAKDSGNYLLVASQVADKIASRNASYIAYQADLQQLEQDEEDPYAGYEIPDDLMW
ncbi:MAG: DUF2058 family protein [Kangiellaceae bacterium]|nr:DUF2058 family protein [Kangiellaceae bacterium]